MTTDLTRIAVLALAAFLCGCSKEYQHADVGKDSPLGKKASAMIESLRSAGKDGLPGVMQQDGAGGLNQGQQAMLQAALEEIAAADKAELTDMESFGKNVCRASIKLTSAGKTREMSMLMVISTEQLKWAGKN